jgi:hypothetical protein
MGNQARVPEGAKVFLESAELGAVAQSRSVAR